jgi:hypothetical protein
MNRGVAVALLLVNLLTFGVTTISFQHFSRRGAAVESQEIQRRLADQLGSVTTPDQMRAASGFLAEKMAKLNSLLYTEVKLTDVLFRLFLSLSVINVSLVLPVFVRSFRHPATPPV